MKIILSRWWLPVMLVLALTLSLVLPVQAAEFNPNGRLKADEVVDDDLFITAQTVIVDGRVNGLLFAGGNTVTINGTINGDVFAFGSKVLISENAEISGNLFAAAQTIEVNGKVGGSIAGASAAMIVGSSTVGRNLYYGGYSLEVQPGVSIERSLYAGAYQVMLSGEVARNMQVGAGAVEINGKIGGDLKVDLGEVSESGQEPGPFFFGPGAESLPPAIQPGLRISPQAEIGGKLTYTSSVELSSTIQTEPKGGIVFQTPVPDEEQRPVGARDVRSQFFKAVLRWMTGVARDFFTLMILGLLAIWLIPGLVQRTAEQVSSKPLPAAGYGVVTLIVGYVGALFLAVAVLLVGILAGLITFGGLNGVIFGVGFSSLSGMLAVFTLLFVYGGTVILAYLLGDWILGKLVPQAKGRRYWAVVIGVVIFVIVYAIPVLGWLVWFVTAIIGLGAMWLHFQASRKPAPASLPSSAEVA